MKRVLIITYHFPPDSEVGGLRAQKYAKYLPSHGWTPTVLTVNEKYYPKKDYSRMADVTCDIHRTRLLPGMRDLYLKSKEIAGRLNRLVSGSTQTDSAQSAVSPAEENKKGIRTIILKLMWLPDDRTGWILPAIFASLKLARRHDIDTIMTTSPPHSVQIIGLILKYILRKRWVIDFRDPWSLFQGGSTFLAAEKWLEGIAVKHADKVITATERVRDHLRESYPELPSEKFVCIPNGFDLEDFRKIERERNSYFSISYIGDFYIKRSPETYLKAVSELIREGKIDPDRIRLRFIGKVRYIETRPLSDLLSEFALEEKAEIRDVVPYMEAIRHMRSSDVLVVLSPQTYIQPMKAFEYMVSGSHVIAFTPPGALADLIANYSKGFVVGLNDLEGAKKAILSCYEAYLNGTSGESQSIELSDYVLSFERRNLTRRLTQYL